MLNYINNNAFDDHKSITPNEVVSVTGFADYGIL
jgi:hypothetical protein